MNKNELNKTLEDHKEYWDSGFEKGKEADLRGADLRGANLFKADLFSAKLSESHLLGANLFKADLRKANLFASDLGDTDLRCADLRGADLFEADLTGADLRGADLREANLFEAELPERTFVIYGEDYFVSIENGKSARFDSYSHSIDDWFNFSNKEIADMDGERALKFYPRLLDIIDFYVKDHGNERPDWMKEK